MKRKMTLIIGFILFTACAREIHPSAHALDTGLAPREAAPNCTLKFKNSQLCLSWSWEKPPLDRDTGTMTFKVYRPNRLDGSPVVTDLPELPTVVLWMPSMGHGSSPTQTEQIDTGTYRCKNVFFVMPGTWQIKFQVKNGTTVQDEAIDLITL